MAKVQISAFLALVAALLLAGCGGTESTAISLIAATSLKQAIEPLVIAYNDQYADVEIRSSFAPSDQIQRQMEAGHDAELIATASAEHMQPLVAADLAIDAQPFASNTMIIAVGDHAKGEIKTLKDLSGNVRISIGDSTVPVGKYAQQVIDALGSRMGADFAAAVRENIVNRAGSAADVITPVALGGVDASISYTTDARANADRVSIIAVPAWAQPKVAYWAAISPTASAQARSFLDFIQSPNGQKALEAEGFAVVDAAAGEKP